MRHEVTTRRVLYEIPGMRSIQPRPDTFKGADGTPLALEIYDPPSPIADPAPFVALIAGYPDSGFEAHVGCKFMEMAWTISMAQLIAISGMTAVTHTNRDAQPDAVALINHLREIGSRVGLWAISGHGPLAIAVSNHAACLVLINPITAEALPSVPTFIVRAGKDETPGLNAALDPLLARAVAENRPISFVNYTEAPHAFDLYLDTAETRRVLGQGLEFLRAHLM